MFSFNLINLIPLGYILLSFMALNNSYLLYKKNFYGDMYRSLILFISTFLLSISYFPLLNEENRLTRLIKQREKWFAIVFIVFISIISIFTFLDKLKCRKLYFFLQKMSKSKKNHLTSSH